MSGINKILIIRLSSIGDIILSTPLIRAVRNQFRNAEIDFVIKREFSELLETNPHLDKLIPFNNENGFSELLNVRAAIKKSKYDLIIDIHKNFRSFVLKTGTGASIIKKYSKGYIKRSLLLWFRINRYKEVIPVYKRYFKTVEDFGIEYDGEGTEIPVPEHETLSIKRQLSKYGYDGKSKIVVICPGAGFATKRWKKDGYAKTADHLSGVSKTYIVFLGGVKDIELCSEICRKMTEKAVNFAGKLSLIGSASLLKESSLLITNDTGMMHLAQSQNTPVTAIFGPTSYELGYYPFPGNSFVIEKDLDCRPCTHNGSNKCPRGHFKCMEEISSEQVITASEQLLISGDHSKRKGYGENLVSHI